MEVPVLLMILLLGSLSEEVFSKEIFCDLRSMQNEFKCNIYDFEDANEDSVTIKLPLLPTMPPFHGGDFNHTIEAITQAPPQLLPPEIFISILYIHGKKKFQLLKNVFHNFANLQSLTLRSINLNAIDGEFFKGYSLTVCDLDNNSLKVLKDGLFKPLSNSLEYLKLSDSGITKVEKDAFKGLKFLKSLSMRYNQIDNLNSHVFDSLVSLESLDLYQNKLTILHPDLFSNLQSINRLNFDLNRIEHISERLFSKTLNLLNVDLSNNQITSIDPASKPYFLRLKQLNLRGNKCVNWLFDFNDPEIAKNSLDEFLYPSCSRDLKEAEGKGWMIYAGISFCVVLLLTIVILVIVSVIQTYLDRSKMQSKFFEFGHS